MARLGMVVVGMVVAGCATPGAFAPLAPGLPAARAVLRADGPEVPPAPSLPCFPGAIYRKLASSADAWTGVRGVVTLGVPVTDPDRVDPVTHLPLDNFSVYMGGAAGGQEIDAGLTWERTKDPAGGISPQRTAFRPFWRNKTWHNAPAEARYYWYPGDTVTMSVAWIGAGKLRLAIDGAGKSFATDFDAEAWAADAPRQFKRVNAIDQSRNEGQPVKPTRATIAGAAWRGSELLREDGPRPFGPARRTDMRCPAANVAVRATDDEAAAGAEAIDLAGTPPTK